jgi:hypothetical protein
MRLEAVGQGMAVRNARTLLGVSGFLWAVDLGSRSGLIGLITLDVNCAGARSAGNPLATCDVAGAGNQLTVRIVRHSQRKRGATDRPGLRSNGASPRPYRAERAGDRVCGRALCGCDIRLDMTAIRILALALLPLLGRRVRRILRHWTTPSSKSGCNRFSSLNAQDTRVA